MFVMNIFTTGIRSSGRLSVLTGCMVFMSKRNLIPLLLTFICFLGSNRSQAQVDPPSFEPLPDSLARLIDSLLPLLPPAPPKGGRR